MAEDLKYMTRAYHLAMKGRGRTSPNPMVGAVVVKNGRVIGEGWHARCGGPHAEVMAIRQAGARVKASTLYVTLEPCFHQGRTPPCVDLIIQSDIRTVVVGVKDPNPLTGGKSLVKLRRAGITVRTGPLKDALMRLNENFGKYITQGVPFVTAKTAQTLDGKIATATGESKWITSKECRREARRIRNNFDAIMVGVNTVLADDPELAPSRRTKRWFKVILDSRLRISPRARLIRTAGRHTVCIIATTEQAAASRIERLRKTGVEVLVCPSRNGMVDMRFVMRYLAGQREVTSVLLEGGAQMIGRALQERLVDKVHVYTAPILFADREAQDAFAGLTTKRIRQAVQIKNMELRRIGPDWTFLGYLHYPAVGGRSSKNVRR